MIRFISGLLAVVTMSAVLATSAMAQDHTRNWDNGNIVAVTEVHIEPGMFNAYINDLNNVWRKFLEEQMKDGSVVSYGMFGNTSARDGEPDLYLTVTYANWAAFDRGEAYWEGITNKVMGSVDQARSANVKRGELRKLGSEYMLQEIKFRD